MSEFFKNNISFIRRCRLVAEQKAATAIEYSLMAAGVAMAIVVMAFLLGDRVENTFQVVDDEVAAHIAP